MPLDDLSLDLKPPAAPFAMAGLEVMSRVLRLPTRSPRQARAIVRMQLDRLSPLPAADTAFDLVPLRHDGGETVYALGIVRRSALTDPAFGNQRIVAAGKMVEDTQVVFRFRNAGAVDDREKRWLGHAPQAALVCLGVAAVALAGNLRAEQWREQRLPQIAAEQRLAALEARAAGEQAAARAEWTALERADGATRLLCVAALISGAAPNGVTVTAGTADERQVTLALSPGADPASLVAAGAAAPPEQSAASTVTFPAGVCG